MKVTAFVPIRSGSKSIPDKNIKKFFGKPLVYHVLFALQNSVEVNEIVLATDCDEYAKIASDFGFSKLKIYKRLPENAQDTSSTESVMLEYIYRENISDDDLFILAQATSPFTTSNDIDNAVRQLIYSSKDSLLSCVRTKRFFWGQNGVPINYDYQNRPRRQDFEGIFMENGAFYINKVSSIIRNKNRLSGVIEIYEMPEYTALELDEPEDWDIGEIIMTKIYRKNQNKTPDIKVVLSDVDGVLTDAGMYYSEKGDEIKKFCTYDGMGFNLLKENGFKVGIITMEDRELNRRRSQKLKLDFDFHGIKNKLETVENLCKELNITLENIAYIGDDINDFDLLCKVGLAACPKNAVQKIKTIPGIIHLSKAGGKGAFREFTELLLKK